MSKTKRKVVEFELLLSQRKELIEDIKELNGNVFKVIVAITPIIVSTLLSYFGIFDEAYAPIIRFILLQIILLLSMVICACLFAANVNRDYIAAIDTYIFKVYKISVLFHNGELSRKHTTGIKGVFPLTTGLIAFDAIAIIGILGGNIIRTDLTFYKEHMYLIVFFISQVILYAIIVISNMKRKITRSSEITKECLVYFDRKDEGE